MGECYANSTSQYEIYNYFEGCDYSDDDWNTLFNIIFSWADMTCFHSIFTSACDDYLRGVIYGYFANMGQYGDYNNATSFK